MRSLSCLVLLAAFGCGDADAPVEPAAAPEAAEAAMAPVVATAPEDPARQARITALSDWLSGCAVTPAAFVRHKLYTWTRPAQIEELRAPRARLLSREHGPSGQQSLFDLAIAEDDHPLARRLRHRSQRTRRFAWVTPWATRMGWEGGDYGDRLIEVTLREGAWTAIFDARAEPRWRVVDSDGAVVSGRDVTRSPERVAAVYHVGVGSRAYREVVLVNEAQIERWAYATDSIRERARVDAEQLRLLAEHFEAEAPQTGEDFGEWLEQGWSDGASSSLVERYRACLALGSAAYAPSPTHLRSIADALDPLAEDRSLERTVAAPRRRIRPRASRPPPSVYCDPTMGCNP